MLERGSERQHGRGTMAWKLTHVSMCTNLCDTISRHTGKNNNLLLPVSATIRAEHHVLCPAPLSLLTSLFLFPSNCTASHTTPPTPLLPPPPHPLKCACCSPQLCQCVDCPLCCVHEAEGEADAADQHPHRHHALADQVAAPGIQHQQAQVDGQAVGRLKRRLGSTKLTPGSKGGDNLGLEALTLQGLA